MLYYALLSGEHPHIPRGELRAILEAERVKYRPVMSLDQLELIEVHAAKPEKIVSRAAMVKEVGVALKILEEPTGVEEIVREAREIPWEEHIRPGQSFLVRAKRVKRSLDSIDAQELERRLGALIHEHLGVKVDVKMPDVTVRTILTSERCIVGIRLAKLESKGFHARRPKARPFFHPGALDPKLSRVFVNLSRISRGQVMADPFCGTGSFLIEAALIGAFIVGSDIRRDMVEGCMLNLKSLGIEALGIVRADATKPPFTLVDAVATDPPYGRSSTTMGRRVSSLVYDFLNAWADVIPKGGHVCYAVPQHVNYEDTLPKRYYRLREHYIMRVHKSLTRIIVVAERL